jgi:hypothetical protein
MKNAPEIDENIFAWIRNKKKILNGSFDRRGLASMLQGIMPENKSSKFERKDRIEDHPTSGKKIDILGFQVTLTLSIEHAQIVKDAMAGDAHPFSFAASTTFSPSADNKSVNMQVATVGDFTKTLLHNARYIAGKDTEKYAKYAVFRGVVQSLAKAGIYQFDPDGVMTPRFPTEQNMQNIKVNDFLDKTKMTYIGRDKAVDKIIEDVLTTMDRLDLTDIFHSHLDKPENLIAIRDKYNRAKMANDIQLKSEPLLPKVSTTFIPKPI